MVRRWRARSIGFVLIAALTLAACSGSDDDAVPDELRLEDTTATTAAPTTTTTTTVVTTTTEPPPPTADEVNAALGRGMNFGNSLESPREGDWGAGLDASYFGAIADAGFDHVRLPVSWADYADENAPFVIPDDDPTVVHPDYDSIWERVDWAIEQAEANDLMLVLNMHHYDDLHRDPEAEAPRFLAMWQQIAERYEGVGEHVVFELLNEPSGAFTENPDLWNDLFADALEVVRAHHPSRVVLVGGVDFNSVPALDTLQLPDDPYLIATVHVYTPFDFTHQGAPWVVPVLPTGVRWEGDGAGLSSIVDNTSWDTRVDSAGPSSLAVTYATQWAGFSVDYGKPTAPESLRITIGGEAELRVTCRADRSIEIETLLTTADVTDYEIDLSSCPSTTSGVYLKNARPGEVSIVVDHLEYCHDGGCDDLIVNQAATLIEYLTPAAEWSDANGVPVNVGEFGAFGANGEAAMSDRADWTKTVQDFAVDAGMSSSYWEFHSGFGAFDLETGQWVPELLAALID